MDNEAGALCFTICQQCHCVLGVPCSVWCAARDTTKGYLRAADHFDMEDCRTPETEGTVESLMTRSRIDTRQRPQAGSTWQQTAVVAEADTASWNEGVGGQE